MDRLEEIMQLFDENKEEVRLIVAYMARGRIADSDAICRYCKSENKEVSKEFVDGVIAKLLDSGFMRNKHRRKVYSFSDGDIPSVVYRYGEDIIERVCAHFNDNGKHCNKVEFKKKCEELSNKRNNKRDE
jgi:hypothetical protein